MQADCGRASGAFGRGNPTLAGASKKWATPSARDWKSGQAGQATLEKNARPLSEQAEKLWPTPCADNPNDRENPETWLKRKKRHAEKAEKPTWASMPLAIAAALWPTPTVNGNNNRKGASPTSQDGLSTAAIQHGLPHKTTPRDGAESSKAAPTSRRRLNPRFVEWLMGWPIGHTALEPLATDKCREWQSEHGAS
jgi:DNA (cytosine-5)-methyltransferase 1